MSRRRITLEVSDQSFIIRGWRGRDLAVEAGVKPLYAGTVGGWLADLSRLPQVCAYLDHRNVSYEVVGDAVQAPADGDVHRSDDHDGDDDQLGLFDGPAGDAA